MQLYAKYAKLYMTKTLPSPQGIWEEGSVQFWKNIKILSNSMEKAIYKLMDLPWEQKWPRLLQIFPAQK